MRTYKHGMRSLAFSMILIGALASGGTATALSQGANPAAVKAKPRVMLKACVDLKTYKATIMPKRFYCPKNSKYISLTPIKHPVSKIAINGTGAPIDNVTGKDGDVYIDVANLLIFGPRENGVWGPGKSLLGATGAAGAPGAKGETGTAGAPGAAGTPGPMGPQGVPGVAGAAGAVGPTGPAGMNGSTILTGTSAPAPETGTVGDYYIDITNNNLYGPKTDLGWGAVISTVGPQGPQGDPGVAGPPGPAGADGTDGTNGSTILTGSGVPDGALGAVGDYYIDTVTANLYGPKTLLGWGAVISTVGPQGPQGIQGVQGVPGPAGPQGETGTVIATYGAFHDQSTIILAADTTVPIPLGVTDLSYGVTSSGATGIVTIANAGIYNIAFSTVFDKTNANAGDVFVWLRQNGVDVPWTATVVTIAGSSRMVAAWNFFVAAAPGDTFQLMVRTPAATIQILTVAATADVPAIPSTILTVNQVGSYTPPV